MPTTQTWHRRYTGTLPDTGTLQTFADTLEISQPFAALLWQRGFQDLGAMSRFLAPNLRNLAPLDEWPDFIQAARVLFDALEEGRSMLVWGDYDVDGITATALVKDFMRFHGIEARHHIPSRLEAGYGLNADVIEKLAAEGVSLILTVDCGISDVEPVARAKELGMRIIISDHHLPGEELPAADAI